MADVRFRLGRLVATSAAVTALEEANQDPAHFLTRHHSGDWGGLDEDDRASNDRAIAHEGNLDEQGRVLSSYQTKRGVKIWVITEGDRSATTILLPEDY